MEEEKHGTKKLDDHEGKKEGRYGGTHQPASEHMASGAQALSLLGFNHSVTSLNLRGSRLGVNGGVLVAEKLLAHSGGCALSYLNLRGNDIRGVGAVAVARALASHPNNLINLGGSTAMLVECMFKILIIFFM